VGGSVKLRNFSPIWTSMLHLQAETDRVKGLGVMLFHIEGTLDDLVSMEHFGV
jgi:hypothetical protein